MSYESNLETGIFFIEPQGSPVAIAVHRVPEGHAQEFEKWQRGIVELSSKFPGYQRTTVFLPNPGVHDEWITTTHFDTPEQLDVWLQSDERKNYIEGGLEHFKDFDLEISSVGFDQWFSKKQGSKAPPGWKMVLTVVLVLFPSVMLLSAVINPVTASWGWNFPETMLVGNFASVSVLQWIAMPIATYLLAWWLKPTKVCGVGVTLGGVLLIAVLLLVMVLLFNKYLPT